MCSVFCEPAELLPRRSQALGLSLPGLFVSLCQAASSKRLASALQDNFAKRWHQPHTPQLARVANKASADPLFKIYVPAAERNNSFSEEGPLVDILPGVESLHYTPRTNFNP